jgi:hypothetical protein
LEPGHEGSQDPIVPQTGNGNTQGTIASENGSGTSKTTIVSENVNEAAQRQVGLDADAMESSQEVPDSEPKPTNLREVVKGIMLLVSVDLRLKLL